MIRLFLLSTLFILASCGLKVGNIDVGKMYQTTKAVATASKTYTVEEEMALGQSIAAKFLGASKYYQNQPVQDYVSNIGHWLVMQLPEQKFKWHFVVLEDEMFNAYSTPGGIIFINTGMLEQLNNEAQLAAILAHEIIHVYRSHHINTIQSNAKTHAWSNALSMAADQSKNKKIRTNNKIWESVGGQINNIYFRGFDKEREFESDHQGLYLLTKAGYDPYAMIEVLQIIQSAKSKSIWFKQFYNTHPKPYKRLQAVYKVIDNKLSDLDTVAILEKRYQSVLAGTAVKD